MTSPASTPTPPPTPPPPPPPGERDPSDGGSTERASNRRWIAACIFALVALKFALRDNMTSNELSTLMAARQLVDPYFLPGDWYLNLHDAPRVPFGLLLFPLTKTLPFVWISIVGRLLGFLVLSAGLARIAVRLRLRLASVIAIGGLYVWLDQAFFFGEWMFGQIEGKVVAYALLFFGLDALLARSIRRAALFFGFATSVHILVGGWGSFALALAVLWLRMGEPRERRLAVLTWFTAASVGIFVAALSLTEPASTGSVDVQWVYVHFRAPHHMDPFAIHPPLRQLVAMPLLLAALVFVRKLLPERDPPRILSAFAAMSVVPCVFGVAAALVPGGARFLQYLPFRVGSLMLLLVGLCLVTSAVVERLPEVWRVVVSNAAAVVVAIYATVGFVVAFHGLRAFPQGGRLPGPANEAHSFEDACVWIRDNTEPEALVIASPSHESVGYLSHRPVAGLYKDVPSSKATLAEWYRRMVAFNDGPFATRGYAVLTEMDKRFAAHPKETYLSLAAAFDGRYLLVRRRTDLDLPELYSNADWSVFDLRQDVTSR